MTVWCVSVFNAERVCRTCLAAMSFPRGMGAPFSVAMRFRVSRAFSWFPVSTSYRALSGSHCGHVKSACHVHTAAVLHNHSGIIDLRNTKKQIWREEWWRGRAASASLTWASPGSLEGPQKLCREPKRSETAANTSFKIQKIKLKRVVRANQGVLAPQSAGYTWLWTS